MLMSPFADEVAKRCHRGKGTGRHHWRGQSRQVHERMGAQRASKSSRWWLPWPLQSWWRSAAQLRRHRRRRRIRRPHRRADHHGACPAGVRRGEHPGAGGGRHRRRHAGWRRRSCWARWACRCGTRFLVAEGVHRSSRSTRKRSSRPRTSTPSHRQPPGPSGALPEKPLLP